MDIGVLALQGAVKEHIRSIELAGGRAIPIKKVDHLAQIDGLIIPGGESTTISKLMNNYGFIQGIQDFAAQGKAIFGTCAGAILMAKQIEDQVPVLGLMDIKIKRNAFGRQRESFETMLNVTKFHEPFNAVFIRAPLFNVSNKQVEILSTYNKEIVVAQQGNLLACAFHPELTDDYRLHQYFLKMVR